MMRTVESRIHWHASSTWEHHGQQNGALAGLGERKVEEGREGSDSEVGVCAGWMPSSRSVVSFAMIPIWRC